MSLIIEYNKFALKRLNIKCPNCNEYKSIEEWNKFKEDNLTDIQKERRNYLLMDECILQDNFHTCYFRLFPCPSCLIGKKFADILEHNEKIYDVRSNYSWR